MVDPKAYKNLHHKRGDLLRLIGTKRAAVLDEMVPHHVIVQIEQDLFINPQFSDYEGENLLDRDEISYMINTILLNMMQLHLGLSEVEEPETKSEAVVGFARSFGLPYEDMPVRN